MNRDYDVKGCVFKFEQRKPRKYGLEHLPNRDSFDVEFSPTGHVLKKTDYTFADGVYRSCRFVYDNAGRLIRAVESDANGIGVAFSDFEYSAGRRLSVTRDKSGTVRGRDIDEFDGDRLILLGTYDAEGHPKRLKSFEYDNGKLSRAVSRYHGLGGDLIEISISRFDAHGRVVEAFGLTPDGKPNGDGRYTYEYDDVGRKHRILSYNDLEDTGVPSSIRGFTYKCDEQGNWTEQNEYYRSRSDSDWSQRVTTRKLTYYIVD